VFAVQDDLHAVHTPAFDGPLELLLYLIRRDGIDVRNLPIAHITREYLRFMEGLEEFDLDLAGDFLVMAATLCQLKSRELLPRRSEQGAAAEEEDPRERLVRRLLEYRRYKQASEALLAAPMLGRDVFARPVEVLGPGERPIDPGVDVFGLLEAFAAAAHAAPAEDPVHVVELEEYSLSERVASLRAWLAHAGGGELKEAFRQCRSRGQRVVTFLALLEMARLNLVAIAQAVHLGTVRVSVMVGAAEADLSALPLEA